MNKLLACAIVVAIACPARADKLDIRQRYEETLVQRALDKVGLVVDPAPDGKTIERVVIVANDVILPGDFPLSTKIPWTWLNHLHVRTRDYIIRQELLFHVGEALHRDVVDETGRNLRALFILAVARLVVASGSTPDKVVVLVVTKDQWTLRANTDFTTDQARLDTFSASISESNLAGRNKTASIAYALDPGRHTIGAGYVDPRMGGTREALTLNAGVYLTRGSGALEGEYGNITVGRPLFSLRTQWSWQVAGSYTSDVVRQFQGGTIRQLSYGSELIPDFFHERVWNTSAQVTRSFGIVDKLNITLGFLVASSLYNLTSDFPSTLSAGARAAYIATLPRSESSSGPFVQAQIFRASYVRLQNIDTYALSEDFRVGPSASLYVRFSDPVFGFDEQHTTVTASYGAAYFIKDDLLQLNFGLSARLEGGVIPGANWVNEIIDVSFRNASPKFGPFRLHIAGAAEFRHDDLTNARLSLGSDSGLRGYEPRYFVGNNFYRLNVELRTMALNLWTIHVGGAIFYDGGDAPATLLVAGWHQDAGFGLRILFPQFNKDVLRLDLAFPFEQVAGISYQPRFTVSFGQAF